MKQALLFDIDGTLTPPRMPLEPEMAHALGGLRVPFHVAAGSHLELVRGQFFEPLWRFGFRGELDAFLSNGATRYRCSLADHCAIELADEFSFRGHLGEPGYARLLAALRDALERFPLPRDVTPLGNRVVDRVSMINFCPIGRPDGPVTPDAERARAGFVAFDRATGYRRRVLEHLGAELGDLVRGRGLLILLGGQTSFDLCIEGRDKTAAVRHLLARGVDRVTFIGDALFEGGNDSVIARFVAGWTGDRPCPVEAVAVDGWRDTLRVLADRGWRAAAPPASAGGP